MNANRVGIASAPLMTGSSCAAAINGIKKKPTLITFDVQSSGEVRPVRTERTDTIATSAASTEIVMSVRVSTTVRAAVRSAQVPQNPTSTAYSAKSEVTTVFGRDLISELGRGL